MKPINNQSKKTLSLGIAAGILGSFLPISTASACDVCALYNVSAANNPADGSFYAATAFQLNTFDDVRLDGDEVDAHGQKLTNSNLQFVLGYQATEKIGLQVNTPFIFRHYKRLPHHDMSTMAEGETMPGLETGNEDGLGDMSALLTLNALNHRTADWFVGIKLMGGLKLPTGDTSRLKEEAEDTHMESSAMAMAHDGMHEDTTVDATMDPSHAAAIHGHDLALGSGSFDFPLVLSMIAERGPIVAGANLQYTFRTEGDSGYRYADDLVWRISAGYRYFIDEQRSVALHGVMNGETKDKDESRSVPQEDTGLTSMFMGPELEVLWNNLSAEVGLELPVVMDNTGLQAVTTSRWRFGVTYRF